MSLELQYIESLGCIIKKRKESSYIIYLPGKDYLSNMRLFLQIINESDINVPYMLYTDIYLYSHTQNCTYGFKIFQDSNDSNTRCISCGNDIGYCASTINLPKNGNAYICFKCLRNGIKICRKCLFFKDECKKRAVTVKLCLRKICVPKDIRNIIIKLAHPTYAKNK
jgi:hypothetical protein